MLELPLLQDSDTPLNVLCLGAHCDDIEIGCGATLLALLEQHSKANIYWQVFSSTPDRKNETNICAARICSSARNVTLEILDFRDGYLPYSGNSVKDAFEATKGHFDPHVIFTHYRHDLHQDHRLISDMTWNTFRDHFILEYEIPKWDGDLGTPNTYVPVRREIAEAKISALLDSYVSQNHKKWFSADLFWAMLRIRGMECNSESGLAEAFYTRKLVLGSPE